MAQSSLLKFQIGPVQDFIAQARSTRDLWSGSYLLSFLVAAGIRELISQGGALVFPSQNDQPLLKYPFDTSDIKKLLTPNIPNLFVAEISSENPSRLAKNVEQIIRSEWDEIAEICFKKLEGIGVLEAKQEIGFLAQAKSFLSISWQITPLGEDYESAYQKNARQLDAVRQTRDFPSNPIPTGGEKDSLSGRDHAFVMGKDALARCRSAEYKQLFKHEGDHLSSITLIKRVWHLAYLTPKCFKADSKVFPIRSTRAIAARDNENDDAENTDKSPGEKYLAAIAFDGDSIGKWISGELIKTDGDLRSHHSAFSLALSNFALKRARDIVEKPDPKTKIPLGFLIYAGGDDVVALVPADAAIDVAREIREAFKSSTASIKGKDGDTPDASAGIAISHFKSPLQDLIREAQKAEKDAKRDIDKGGQGRSAFSITLMKRSGEISKWGAKWDKGAITLHDAIFEAMTDNHLSAKFPHRVCQLLEPYRTAHTGFYSQFNAPDFPIHEIVEKEFLYAATRQGSKEIATSLNVALNNYLQSLGSDPQIVLTAMIGLCTTLAFTHRNLPKQSAE